MKEKPDTPAQLKARALRFLVRREHSRMELIRKLAPYAESEQALNAVADLLQSKKQLSDERFAEERARSLSRKYGAAMIRQDLKERGIAEEIVGRISAEGDLDRAKAILSRKYRAAATTREEHAKRARFLQSRGFSYEVIRSVLKPE